MATPTTSRRRRDGAGAERGLTLLEVLIACVVAAALAAIAIPSYEKYMDGVRVDRAKVEITAIAAQIERYHNKYHTYPPDLAALGSTIPLDPWGNAYQYLAIDVNPAPKTGQVMKDRSLHPLNSDFDLYSLGADGESTKQIASKSTQDDVVRAANGGYIGLASGY